MTQASSSAATGFLYPFLDRTETGPEKLLADLATSAAAKIAASDQLQAHCLGSYATELRACAAAIAARFRIGGRLYTFGNGGSSTDATTVASLFARPPWGDALPACCLSDDQAVLTALGNDVGFELIFARQLMACGRPSDMVIALSTSGCSPDLVTAIQEAHRRGMLTIALAGYDGGRLGAMPEVDHCFTVPSQSVHRIQEAQARLAWQLWSDVQDASVASPPARNGGF
jgi:D-sedoheptulose 7-phosphate isomerase